MRREYLHFLASPQLEEGKMTDAQRGREGGETGRGRETFIDEKRSS